MFESIMKLFRKITKKEEQTLNSKDAAKERLHLVLMQDRANVSADFLDLMKQEIIEVIKKYIEIDEEAIDVRLTNKENTDGSNGAPALYANIPILNIKDEARKSAKVIQKEEKKQEETEKEKQEPKKQENTEKSKTNDKKEENKNQKEESSNKPSQQKNKNKEEKQNAKTQEKIKEEKKTKTA